jgi:hypothetical protein
MGEVLQKQCVRIRSSLRDLISISIADPAMNRWAKMGRPSDFVVRNEPPLDFGYGTVGRPSGTWIISFAIPSAEALG